MLSVNKAQIKKTFWYVGANIFQEYTASIFIPANGGRIFLRNVDKIYRVVF
jgi:hypothetical protein